MEKNVQKIEITSEILHGRDIICFSQDWTGDWLLKTQVILFLSKGNRILRVIDFF